jgi:hypothetical protein
MLMTLRSVGGMGVTHYRQDTCHVVKTSARRTNLRLVIDWEMFGGSGDA